MVHNELQIVLSSKVHMYLVIIFAAHFKDYLQLLFNGDGIAPFPMSGQKKIKQ